MKLLALAGVLLLLAACGGSKGSAPAGTFDIAIKIVKHGKQVTIRVAHWQVGKVELPATTIVEANLPFGNASGGVQGLLGSDMLSEFDVVTIDYTHGLLKLHHRG